MNRTRHAKIGSHGGQRIRLRLFWPYLLCVMAIQSLGIGLARAEPDAHVLRFSDTPYLHRPVSTTASTRIHPTSDEPDVPMTNAKQWLQRNGWRQVWPLLKLGQPRLPHFAGPATQRYLRIHADRKFVIWGRRITIDPYRFPSLAITWGVERFPKGAALDIYDRNDRSIAVTISFGRKLRSPGLLPNVPRALAFFWGETETVGKSYTCIKPRKGPAGMQKMGCKYPHVKYIALRRGGAGSIHTDRVNLLTQFKRHFPDYWAQHQRVPPVAAVSFEARSDQTESNTLARLYAIAFAAQAAASGQDSNSSRPGK